MLQAFLTPCTFEASVASLVARAPVLCLGLSKNDISCITWQYSTTGETICIAGEDNKPNAIDQFQNFKSTLYRNHCLLFKRVIRMMKRPGIFCRCHYAHASSSACPSSSLVFQGRRYSHLNPEDMGSCQLPVI